MQTPPRASWELEEANQYQLLDLDTWMDQVVSNLEPLEPLENQQPRKYFQDLEIEKISNHRNRGGKFELTVKFKDLRGKPIHCKMEQLLECHKAKVCQYWREVAKNPRRWNPIVNKHPAVAQLIQEDQEE